MNQWKCIYYIIQLKFYGVCNHFLFFSSSEVTFQKIWGQNVNCKKLMDLIVNKLVTGERFQIRRALHSHRSRKLNFTHYTLFTKHSNCSMDVPKDQLHTLLDHGLYSSAQILVQFSLFWINSWNFELAFSLIVLFIRVFLFNK